MIILYTIVFLRLREREKARLLLQQSKEHKHREGIKNLPPPPLSVSDALINGSRIVQHLGCHFKMESDRLVLEIVSSLQLKVLQTTYCFRAIKINLFKPQLINKLFITF